MSWVGRDLSDHPVPTLSHRQSCHLLDRSVVRQGHIFFMHFRRKIGNLGFRLTWQSGIADKVSPPSSQSVCL